VRYRCANRLGRWCQVLQQRTNNGVFRQLKSINEIIIVVVAINIIIIGIGSLFAVQYFNNLI
jgi:hypothetical protein